MDTFTLLANAKTSTKIKLCYANVGERVCVRYFLQGKYLVNLLWLKQDMKDSIKSNPRMANPGECVRCVCCRSSFNKASKLKFLMNGIFVLCVAMD